MDLDSETRKAVLAHILERTDPRNRGWLDEYFTEGDNFDQCVVAVLNGTPYVHGFRGYDMQDALRALGLYPPQAPA